ncbi:DUF2834 domain-containing protein [Thermosynechococcus sp. JY1334]|uniref:DUF2834 domain-containing protein n=1 Tax=unclassified Thermosynechococcus TaxID=2622553 RepID=UPI002673ACD3|nr:MULTISPECIES: DUF2834 domain-containing protein [unclassified Thermosynechococcus]MDR7897875.1 DUF2834 domain-containing protein [Thermosynechococcus sp. JY1332]MDR7905274.1 DUF2834 domain-containing protein [Thermosynechococcus sp. JY1334]MDR7993099.1 DUF2834 domain-containing protein [Thermosynechococcus sp. TG252]WKT87487.1 DUF2834 domain-containing protein [Thermosynechococcus sp. JY1339]WNC56426.1 DUF2834 domain-containing protein [Thermosynechococcus sp. JY1331]
MRIFFAVLWLGLIVYSFGFAPPDQPQTLTLIQRLATGDWQGINPLIVSLFNLMGVWPLIYTALLVVDGQEQRFPAWPFAVFSFAVGAFALLPYFILRQPAPIFSGELNRGIRLWESRLTAVVIGLLAVGFLGYGLVGGDWPDFWQQWQTSRFIHVMSLDFCLLSLLLPVLLVDDWQRRGLEKSPWRWWSLVPLLGALGYLLLRPPLILSKKSVA